MIAHRLSRLARSFATSGLQLTRFARILRTRPAASETWRWNLISSFAAEPSSRRPTSAEATSASRTAASPPWPTTCRVPPPRSTRRASWCLPGGIDSHVHFDQPMGPGIVMADGFESGTRSAAAGGNTTVLSFALQPRGQSLRQSVEDYHEKAKGQSYVDYGFHLIVTDPTPAVLGQELPALVSSRLPVVQGVHDLRRPGSDRPAIARSVQRRARARRVGDGACGRLRPDQVHDRPARARRQDPFLLSRGIASRIGRAGGDPSGDLARRIDRHPDHDRARLGPRGDGADPVGARTGDEDLR